MTVEACARLSLAVRCGYNRAQVRNVQDLYLTKMRSAKIASHLKSAIPAKGHPHDGAAGTKAHIGHGILTVRLHTVGTEKESYCHNTWNRKTSKGWCILSLSNTWKRHFQIEKFAGQILETENPNSPCGPKNRSLVPPSLSFSVGWRQKLSTVS